MKNFKWLTKFSVFLIGLIVTMLCSCRQSGETPYEDVINKQQLKQLIVEVVDSIDDVKFVKSEDFVHHVINMKKANIADSILIHSDFDIVQQIAEICINKYGQVSKKSFIREWYENYDNVYKFMNHGRRQYQKEYEELNVNKPPLPNKKDTIASVVIEKEQQTK